MIFLYSQEFDLNNQVDMNESDDLKLSDVNGLDPDEHAEIHGYADQYVDWSFSTLPSQIINIWALDAFQYSLWIAGLTASGYLLSTSSSDSGRFNVPEGNTWYIVFWNDEIGSQYTVVTYNANFVGDSRPPAINIISPSSTSTYQTGSNHIIEWSTQGSVGTLKIELFKGVMLFSTIIASTPNDGQHNWQVPGTCPEASDYRIKITDNTNTTVSDYSSYFTIIEVKSFTILYPINTSEVIPKTTHYITWESTGSIDEVKIELFKGPNLLKLIVASTENDGSHFWIPHYYEKDGYMWHVIPEGSDYRIKISDTHSNTFTFSEYFTITNVKSLTILEPTSSSSYKQGEIMTIRWETDTPCETLIIKVYYRPSGQTSSDLKAELSAPNIGYYNWTIPMDLPHGRGYWLWIDATDDSVKYCLSEDFTIGNPSSNNSILSYPLPLIISIIFFITTIYLYQNLKNQRILYRKQISV